MIVTAFLDLSEGGRKPALPEGRTPVVLFVSSDNADLDGALAAIKRCRLIREGHVFTTEIAHGVNYQPNGYRLGDDGEVRFHWGSLLGGQITCQCGWKSHDWVHAADAEEEFAQHLRDEGVK